MHFPDYKQHRVGPPGRQFPTNPGADPLGLAAEVYYARTGRLDYQDRLDAMPDPNNTAGGTVYDSVSHPFQHCFVEQGHYNAEVKRIQADVANPALYQVCRSRWYNNRDPEREKTSPCMRIYCPSCWMTKVELAYKALNAAQAPVFGIINTDVLSLGRDVQECMTQKARLALVGATSRLSDEKRDKAWRPLYWALFPVPGLDVPGYRFVGIFAAAQTWNRKSHWKDRTPNELAEFGVPRLLDVDRVGHEALSQVTAWEHAFTGPNRADDAWRKFREFTPVTLIMSSDDSTPGDTDGDAIRAEGDAITWSQTQRSYTKVNTLKYADLAEDISTISDPRLNDAELDMFYQEARQAHGVYLRRLLDCRKASASISPKSD